MKARLITLAITTALMLFAWGLAIGWFFLMDWMAAKYGQGAPVFFTLFALSLVIAVVFHRHLLPRIEAWLNDRRS
jgi:membrane protein implicated in regulation of membrane protease activity